MHKLRFTSLFISTLLVGFIIISSTPFPQAAAQRLGESPLASTTNSRPEAEKIPRVESAATPEVMPKLVPNIESAEHPEVGRKDEIKWRERTPLLDRKRERAESDDFQTMTVQESSLSIESLAATAGPSLGPNLVPNFDLENTNTSGLPVSWLKGGYGVNTRSFTYPASGFAGSKGAGVTISSYTSGDAKWYSAEIPVRAGKTYRFSNSYQSTVPSFVTLRYKQTDGSYIYRDILSPSAQTSMTTVETNFTAPPNVVSLSIFHLIKSVGTLTTDNYYVQEVIPSTGTSDNLMPNPDLESSDGANPASWFKGGYGVNGRSFTYPATGVGGSKGAEVKITSYSSGDAKWYHSSVPLQPGSIYTFTDAYNSNTDSIITAQFSLSNGSVRYLDLATLPSSAGTWKEAVVDFVAPEGTEGVKIFHLIKSVGTLTIDNVGLYEKTGGGSGVFDTGAVSLSFDDGWRAHHDVAMTKLNAVGLKGTFYIISRQLTENGFPGFLTAEQLKAIHASGHEIGAHTQTHKPLTSLSASEQTKEIEGSRTDLENMGVGPITTFAYPFGDYDTSVLSIVKQTPYEAARATLNGNVTLASDLYQLPRFSVESNTTLANVTNAIDTAIANKQWIILVFHRIDTSGERYSTTPSTFNAIADYIDSKNVYVPTIAEGIDDL